jgi:hypothetical protein
MPVVLGKYLVRDWTAATIENKLRSPMTVAIARVVRGNTRHQPSGAGTTGSATLVKEGGAWKIDDEAWATPQQESPL